MTQAIRILLTDDQDLFRSGIRVILDAQDTFEVVGEAADGEEALRKIESLRPDIVLLDMRMPVMDGVETVRRLFSGSIAEPLPRVIVLTTFALDAAAATAIRYGASGFLLKDSTPEFLFAAVRAVHSGSAVIAPQQLEALFLHDGEYVPAPVIPEDFARLSVRERAVFALAAKGYSNSEIAEQEFVAESTVKSQISSILNKLALRDRVQLVVYAHDHKIADLPAGQ
ncbi:response regulator [Humidisolicoccus flavus]|uniref:response regulator n=1 Tax=Humidisolicoccus flavus TaxID=3111414 RepID=UPI0032513461